MTPVRTESKPPDRLVRSAGIVSVAIALSRVTGLVREMLFARFFGAGLVYDAFAIGFRIPNLTRDLFAEGALSSAFVPIFTKYLTTKGKAEARELYNLVATTLILIVGALCVLGMIFSPQLVELFASPFHKVPGKFELAVSLTRIMFPFLLLVALAAQSYGRFEFHRSVRRTGRFVHLLQHRIRRLWPHPGLPSRSTDRDAAYLRDGVGRGNRRRTATRISDPVSCPQGFCLSSAN